MKPSAIEAVARRIDLAQTHYEVLNLPPGATEDAIRGARNALWWIFHPDLARHERSRELTIRINQAQSVLLDPEERRKYDFANKIKAQTCETCRGKGNVLKQRGFHGKVQVICPACHGVGAKP